MKRCGWPGRLVLGSTHTLTPDCRPASRAACSQLCTLPQARVCENKTRGRGGDDARTNTSGRVQHASSAHMAKASRAREGEKRPTDLLDSGTLPSDHQANAVGGHLRAHTRSRSGAGDPRATRQPPRARARCSVAGVRRQPPSLRAHNQPAQPPRRTRLAGGAAGGSARRMTRCTGPPCCRRTPPPRPPP